jgi:hypothetical protein
MTMQPSPNGTNGATRDAKGRFLPGYPGGPGNPDGKRYAALKRAFLMATSPAKVKQLEAKLFEMAMGGDVQAIKLYFSYSLGAPSVEVDMTVTEERDWKAETEQARVWLEQKILTMHGRMVAAREAEQIRHHLAEGLDDR